MSCISLSDAKPISIQDVTAFWAHLAGASSHQNVGFFRITYLGSGPLYVISLHHSVRMIPFVRSQEELFAATAKRASKLQKLRVVINGPTYGLTTTGKFVAFAGSDPVHPSETLQEGRIVYNGKIIGGSRSDMYFVRNDNCETQKFKFGRGSAPTKADAAIGNLGPLIINGVPFGPINRYNPPVPGAPSEGEPEAAQAKSLIQRSNRRFVAMSQQSDRVGKIALGYRADKAQLIILVQPHDTAGISIMKLRDLAVKLGLDSAGYLDGSDSVMLMIDGNPLISQASNKNETNIVGIGFAY